MHMRDHVADVGPCPAGPPVRLHLFDGADMVVVNGANLGEPVATLSAMEPSDIYRLRPGARPTPLELAPKGADGLTLVAAGTANRPLTLAAAGLATFMSDDGTLLDLLIFETRRGGRGRRAYLLALGPIAPGTEYTLLKASRQGVQEAVNACATASFAAGTHILLAGGRQLPIEALKPGMRVVTRDHGPQRLRSIDHATLRATGDHARVRICRGALNNARDLVVSTRHRLFFRQRSDRLGIGWSEFTMRAGQLVNGKDILKQTGGFAEFFRLGFDRPEIVYAEGIAAESSLAARNGPPDGGHQLSLDWRSLSDARRHGEPSPSDLPPERAAEFLRRAMQG